MVLIRMNEEKTREIIIREMKYTPEFKTAYRLWYLGVTAEEVEGIDLGEETKEKVLKELRELEARNA